MSGTLNGGSVRVLWDADDTAEVTITAVSGATVAFTVGGSAVTFPYTLSASTTFETDQSGRYEVSVTHHGIEIANTPDGTRFVNLANGAQEIFAPTPDAQPTTQFLADLMDGLSTTIADRAEPRLVKREPVWEKFGDMLARPTSPAVVAIGDSITFANSIATEWTGSSDTRTVAFQGNGYLTRAMIDLRQRADWINAGVGGERTDQMLARFDTDVSAYRPHVVIEAGGTNDARQGIAASVIVANKIAMWEKAYAIGAKVVATTVPPSNDSTVAQRQTINTVNAALRRYARANPQDFALVDWHATLVDPLTGGVKAALMDTAGVHPSTTGAQAVGSLFATALNRFLPVAGDILPTDNVNDTANLLSNPLLTGTTGAVSGGATGTVANGWTVNLSGSGGTVAASKVARADGLGEWQQIAVTGTATGEHLITVSGYAAGDVIHAAVEFETDAAGWTDGLFTLLVLCMNGSSQFVHRASAMSNGVESLVGGRHSSGVLVTPPIEIPAGTTFVQFKARKGNAGTVRFGRCVVRKLPTA